jgi:hypothetical protein
LSNCKFLELVNIFSNIDNGKLRAVDGVARPEEEVGDAEQAEDGRGEVEENEAPQLKASHSLKKSTVASTAAPRWRESTERPWL